MLKVISYIVFWGLFGVGAITTLYSLFLLGYRGYLKIKELFTNRLSKKTSK